MTSFNEGNYRPPNLHELNQIPEIVRKNIALHLKDRLTDSIYERLRFSAGQFIDSKAMKRIHANQQKRCSGCGHREVPSYELCFTYENPAVNIKFFAAEIQLREDGSVVKEISFPFFKASPAKLQFINFDQAEKIARQAIKSKYGDDSLNMVELDYSQSDDSIIWVFSKTLKYKRDYFGQFWRVAVSAHNGTVLSSSEAEEIY